MKRIILLNILLCSSSLFAQDGREVYKNKCASCHKLYVEPLKLVENFMENNNTTLKLKAPSINQISLRLKSFIGDIEGDEDMHKMEVDSFVADYLMNPDKSKSVCLPKVLRHFDTMPSLKGKISVEEIEAVSTFLYNYNSQDFKDKEVLHLPYQQALEKAKIENRVILIKLTRDNCRFCKKMDLNVFSDKKVVEILEKDFTVIEINILKEPLPLGLQIGMTPTFIFVNKNEKVMAKIPGAWNKNDFLEILKEAVKNRGDK